MAKFRKKTVVIEAVQYTGSLGNVLDFATESECARLVFSPAERTEDRRLTICTLEGNMQASPGDWLIRGVNGELYPCKPDIFEKTYEPAE